MFRPNLGRPCWRSTPLRVTEVEFQKKWNLVRYAKLSKAKDLDRTAVLTRDKNYETG